MNDLEKKLQPFMAGKAKVKIVEEEFSYDIVDIETGQVYGYVNMEGGKFTGFEIEPVDDDMEPGHDVSPLNKEIILETAQAFVDSFVDREVHFSMLNEWTEDNFMVIYEEHDPELGIPIPHTGCTLCFTREGLLISANIGQDEYELEYPEIAVSSEGAKQILRRADSVQLSLNVPHREELGSTPAAELIYRTNHDIMGVSINGEIDTVTAFMDAGELPTEKIQKVKSSRTMEDMLAVSKNLVKATGEDASVIWINPHADSEEEEPVISMFSDASGHFSYSNVPYNRLEEGAPLSLQELQEYALEYMELAEGEIHAKYVLEKPVLTCDNEPLYDEELVEEEAEDEDVFFDFEPAQMFTFYREHAGYRIEGREAHVHVGLYTGTIRECSVTRLTPEQETCLEKVELTPVVTKEEAEELFFKELKMKLSRCIKTLDDPSIYTLSYLVDFPGSSGHIEKINAHTGKVSYVETGIIKESD
ncbi:hypothetical protein D3H55_16965 [Bacillus salacetis]|uniref:DUF4901 domain-containing protein n=1 Tax=Bacillus salacetis TaxID=2315464 RepID=A0A3A1QU65_9BACI|nr:hypothetical protein [Bacillus salacetis]RIW30425.1 hypothetical protein D3H55_16965 [Bacillus salacetis]